MKVDAREIYLKRILTLDRTLVFSFKDFINLSLLFLEPQDESDKLQEEAFYCLDSWLESFRTDKGVPTLEYILYEMDIMRHYGKKYLLIKTRHVRKKFTYAQLIISLGRLEADIYQLIRQRAKQIRITNPELTGV